MCMKWAPMAPQYVARRRVTISRSGRKSAPGMPWVENGRSRSASVKPQKAGSRPERGAAAQATAPRVLALDALEVFAPGRRRGRGIGEERQVQVLDEPEVSRI